MEKSVAPLVLKICVARNNLGSPSTNIFKSCLTTDSRLCFFVPPPLVFHCFYYAWSLDCILCTVLYFIKRSNLFGIALCISTLYYIPHDVLMYIYTEFIR